jgi:NADH-quinone oxidoreductase subunit L
VLALLPLLPLAGFLVNATLGKRLPKNVSGGLACAVMVASFLIAALKVSELMGMAPESRQINETLFTWITSGDFTIDLAFRLDLDISASGDMCLSVLDDLLGRLLRDSIGIHQILS